MKKLLVDTFPGIKFTERQRKLFSKVYVDRIVVDEKEKSIAVFLESEYIIPYREVKLFQSKLQDKFKSMGMQVTIKDFFSLSQQYTPKLFWEEYYDSILSLLKEESVLLFNMVYRGQASFIEEKLFLACEDDVLFKNQKDRLCAFLQALFLDKADMNLEVIIAFDLPAHSEEPKGYEVFHKDEQGNFVSRRVLHWDKDKVTTPEEYHDFHMTAVSAQEVADYSGDERPIDDFEFISDETAATSMNAGTMMGFDVPNNGQTLDSSKMTKSLVSEQKLKEKPEDKNKEKNRNVSGSEKKSFNKKSSAKWGKGPVDEACFWGRNCEGEVISIADIQSDTPDAVIDGMVLSVEERPIRGERVIFMISVSDFTDSITVKLFLGEEDLELIRSNISVGKFYKIKGKTMYDTFSHEITMMYPDGIKPSADTRIRRMDTYEGTKRVELHAHTQMSEMDSVVPVGKFVNTAKDWGHKAVAITDHGVVQAFPDADHALDKEGDFKVIYGMEAYLVDDLLDTVQGDKGQDFHNTFVVFDIETTGIGAKSNQIIEIGAVRIVDGAIEETFNEFVNPQRPIPFHIQELTHINDAMVSGADTIEQVLPRFLEFVGDAVLVAHNANFDVGFINQKAMDMGIETDFTVIDTVAVARALLKDLKRFKLDTVAKRLGVSLENHHRAVDDATATAEIFVKMIERLKDQGINNLRELNAFGVPDAETIQKMPSYHAVILAKNETGRVNLYRLVSESHLKYFNRRPKLPKSLYLKWCEGLMIGSACEAGELYRALVEEKSEGEIDRLVQFYDYLEIQPLGNNAFMVRDNDRYPQIQDEEDLKEINRKIVRLGEEYGKLVVATCDVHFMDPEDEIYRRIIMAGKGFKDADDQAPLYFRTTEEMLSEFQYLGAKKAEEIVITNTNLIADMIDKITPCSPRKCPPEIENSDQELRDICYRKAHEIYGPNLPEVVEERLERELKSIIGNGYAVMYIIAQKLVWKSVEDGYLVGSRGSVGSSFAATMAGITEINPLPAHYYCPECHYSDFDPPELKDKPPGTSACDLEDRVCPNCGKLLCKEGHDIPFETFLGFKGNKEPDIDLNFSSEYQSNAHDYTEVIFGYGQTFRAGTVGTLAEKTAYGYVKKYCEEREISKRDAEIARIASGCEGVRRSTGQHPGGIVVLPVGEDIYTFTPVQHPANDMTTKIVTTHFDYHKIDANLLKLDILGHQDPTVIRMLEDLTGVDASAIPMDDKDVLSLFESTEALGISPEDIGGCNLGCLGIPEFGTNFVIGMVQEAKPKNFSDLVRISGLSHGTDVWLNNAQEYIANNVCTLSTAICTRDDIMTFLISKGIENEQAFNIMERVRKGLVAKGKCKEWDEWKQDMIAHDVDEWYIESCEKIKYMFPKAHAAAYVMMALRVAWFKVHMPLAYYAAYFSIRATAFNYELMCQGKETLEYHMDTIKKQEKLSDKDKATIEDMKLVQEMYARGFSFVKIDIYRAKANRFQIVDGKLMPSFATIDGLGDKAAEMIEDEASKGKFLSREDFKNRCKVSENTVEAMARLGLMGDLPHSNQISLMDFFEM